MFQLSYRQFERNWIFRAAALSISVLACSIAGCQSDEPRDTSHVAASVTPEPCVPGIATLQDATMYACFHRGKKVRHVRLRKPFMDYVQLPKSKQDVSPQLVHRIDFEANASNHLFRYLGQFSQLEHLDIQ